MTDDQQRAREQFERWCKGRYRLDKRINVIGDAVYADRWTQGAFVGFTAALRAAPEGFVMVPVELSKHMEDEFRDALWIDANRHNEDVISGISDAWAAALAARPQGVKDA